MGLFNKWRMNADGITINVAIVGRDVHGEFVVNAYNDDFFEATREKRADLRATPIRFGALFPDHVRPVLREKLEACFAYAGIQELEYQCRESAQRWRLSLTPLKLTDSPFEQEVLVTGVDNTTKPNLTHELEVSASRFRAVVDSAYDAIVSIDEQHNITLFNRAAENLFGYRSAEMLGQRIETLLPEQFRANHARNVSQFAVRRRPLSSR
ncbi:PAS domain S-box protein [Paraburkholderia caribensis]|uniref:PAS domain S-box protein n=1 Tax=Paraburkholderia caribensis TaxID=75105 RepID=UPI003F559F63